MVRCVPLAAMLFLSVVMPVGHAQEGIDFEKARQFRQRVARGEKLTDEERAYLERAMRARRRQGREGRPPGGQTPRAKTGLVPLPDMTAEDGYKGEDGGLYGGGRNEPPKEHLDAALREARAIRPLDAQGQPSPDGKVVLISVGMSNTTQEFLPVPAACQRRPGEVAASRHRGRGTGWDGRQGLGRAGTG